MQPLKTAVGGPRESQISIAQPGRTESIVQSIPSSSSQETRRGSAFLVMPTDGANIAESLNDGPPEAYFGHSADSEGLSQTHFS